jgi:hypothetical protein
LAGGSSRNNFQFYRFLRINLQHLLILPIFKPLAGQFSGPDFLDDKATVTMSYTASSTNIIPPPVQRNNP